MPDERERDLWSIFGSAIIADPENDDLRYEFASELEQGELEYSFNSTRAEFIRIQLTLSKLTPSNAEYMRLATRAYALEMRYKDRWIPESFDNFPLLKMEFNRGFVALVAVPAWGLMEYRRLLFENAPVEHVDIVELNGDQQLQNLIGNLGQSGYLNRLVSLGLDGQLLTDRSLGILNNAPFERLQWLSLAHNQITEAGFQILLSGRLRNLRFVNLQDNPFDPSTELFHDQGIVIERRESREWRESRLFNRVNVAQVPWLAKAVRGDGYVLPDRFAVNS